MFVNAVDDPAHGSVYTGGVVRRGGVTVAVSTEGRAPALAGLLREALDAVLPEDVGDWVDAGARLRELQKKARVPLGERRPLLLQALNRLYAGRVGVPSSVASSPWWAPDRATPTSYRARGPARGGRRHRVLRRPRGPRGPRPRSPRAAVRRRQARGTAFHAPGKAINRLLIRAARRGKTCREAEGGRPLRAGPGRRRGDRAHGGGVLRSRPRRHGAVAAPALSGIPVTHRGLATAFVVVSGHDEAA